MNFKTVKQFCYFASLSMITLTVNAQSYNEKVKAYIETYADWAMEEQIRVGIPASITLAQGVHETAAGASELATNANNHFGIKCKKEWTGMKYAYTDDAPNECFRKYNSAKESYIDHSDYLKNSKRYTELFTYPVEDYQSWSKGLKRCGYATNPAYAQKLIKLIEDYKLHEYTIAASTKGSIPNATTSISRIANNEQTTPLASIKTNENEQAATYNNLKAVYVAKGTSLLDVANKYQIKYAKLLEYNELNDAALENDQFIYLEPRRNKGVHYSYQVSEGETIEQIAHKEGMYSKQLRVYNLMAINEQPVKGAILQLQSQSETRPAVYTQMASTQVKNTLGRVKLQDDKAVVKHNDDYFSTKTKLSSSNADNEVSMEIGFGAEPPKFEKENVAINNTPKPVRNNVEQSIPKQKISTTENNAVKESTSDDGELDDVAALKAKLDKVVYARTSKSGTKVSSSDPQSIHSSNPTEANQSKPPVVQQSNAQYHSVAKGETAYSIAKKYGITMKQLNEYNNLNFEAIKVGQKLRIK